MNQCVVEVGMYLGGGREVGCMWVGLGRSEVGCGWACMGRSEVGCGWAWGGVRWGVGGLAWGGMRWGERERVGIARRIRGIEN